MRRQGASAAGLAAGQFIVHRLKALHITIVPRADELGCKLMDFQIGEGAALILHK